MLVPDELLKTVRHRSATAGVPPYPDAPAGGRRFCHGPIADIPPPVANNGKSQNCACSRVPMIETGPRSRL
jgi:hypothetical protein